MSKPKAINFELIERAGKGKSETSVPYLLLDKLVKAHHAHLAEANIAVAWRKNWKEDKDGKLVLGKMQKASDLSRELVEYDAVMLLNMEAWDELDANQRTALVDHELHHLEVAKNDDGVVKRDERDRIVYRIRRHDIEEFRAIVARYGCYKSDLRDFVEAAMESKKAPLLKVAGE